MKGFKQTIFLFLSVVVTGMSTAIDEPADGGLRGARSGNAIISDGQRNLEKACEDLKTNKKFKLVEGGKKKKCSWVAKKPEKRCDREAKYKGEKKLVRELCPKTCGACEEPTEPPTDGPSPNYSIQQCAGFAALNFNIFNYTGCDEYFDENSEVVLAQAGVYRGPKDIEEYVRFADDTSPYIDEKLFYNGTSALVGFDPETGICIFNVITAQGVVMNEDLTRGGTINYGAVQKIYYSIPKNNVPADLLYYPTEFLSEFFTALDADGVNEFICGVLTGPNCQDINELNGNMSKETCVEAISNFPISDGDLQYVDGDTQGCRALHAVFAEENPNHCAHLSLAPAVDPKGNIKCQTSAGMKPTDTFAEAEIRQLNQFCIDQSEIGTESCVVYETLQV